MKITIIGTGYVGLVTATFLSEIGHKVMAIDIDKSKIENLENGSIPFYERGLSDLIKKNFKKRLNFSSNIRKGIEFGKVIYNCVGTPPLPSGETNLEYVFSVAESFGEYLNENKLFINKSTVPVGTSEKCEKIIKNILKISNNKNKFSIASNPEFLREGTAVKDSFNPDRIICGIVSIKDENIFKEIYKPITKEGRPTTGVPIIFTDIKSAELIKYASNCFLATKISFINEIANFCKKVGANINDVSKCMGMDKRIGQRFLHAGIGYGGSCFPKDVKSLIKQGEDTGYKFQIIKSAHKVNENQKTVIINKLLNIYSTIANKVIAVWGLSFKPNTDDVRESPAINIVKELQSRGGIVNTYDPLGMDNFKKEFDNLENINFKTEKYDCLENAEALLILTEWDEFRNVDFEKIKEFMKGNVVVDGRNVYNKSDLERQNLEYIKIG